MSFDKDHCKYYITEEIEVCPYCNDAYGNSLECCGEASTHAIIEYEIYSDETKKTYYVDENDIAKLTIEGRLIK